MKKSIVKFLVVVMCIFFYFDSYCASDLKNVNKAAALNCLDLAADAYGNHEWQKALFQAQLGNIYDPDLADFLYLQAMCYVELGYSISDALNSVEMACKDNMVWQLYDKSSALLLCADLYSKIGKYANALSIVETVQFPTAQTDYIKAVSLYGLKKLYAARKLVEQSLDKWSFDLRFPKLFLRLERDSNVNRQNSRISKKILSRLYLWQDKDPSFLVLASPFEPDKEETRRRLKIYREMYEPFTRSYTPEDLFMRSYALVLSLHYGIVDEANAVKEFFNMSSFCVEPNTGKKIKVKAFYVYHLQELAKIVRNASLRKLISKRLVEYSDCIFVDKYNDGLLNSVVFFDRGRPKLAMFDNNQDGKFDVVVNCNFGIPIKITFPNNNLALFYDNYPAVRSAIKKDSSYTMRPLSLKYPLIEMQTVDLNLFNESSAYSSFFTLAINSYISDLIEKDLLRYAMYVETPNKVNTEAMDRLYLNNGLTVSTETHVNGNVYAMLNYKNGILSMRTLDRDSDGYFETKEIYSDSGDLESVYIDLNKNRKYEYTEKYDKNGNVYKMWDNNEDSKWEIMFAKYTDGHASAEWIHPFTKKSVKVTYELGVPVSMDYLDKNVFILKEFDAPIFWVDKKPAKSKMIAEELLKVFNQTDLPVVSYNVEIGNVEIFATRSGGFIFAHILED